LALKINGLVGKSKAFRQVLLYLINSSCFMDIIPFPNLHTLRLHLREVQDADRPALFRLLTNPQVTEYFMVIPLQEEADAQKVVDMFRRVYREQTGLRWVISLEGQAEAIGIIGFHTYTRGHKGSIVYAIDTQHWGNGYITEAIQAITQYGFDHLDLKRIDAEVLPGNTASEKVLEKNGFQHEGFLQQWLQWGGKCYDVNMYGRVK
jgi:[ribosomal protein S5]-alanine N-acetyltransferase